MQTVMPGSVIKKKKTPIIHKIFVILGMVTFMGGTLTGVMTYLNIGYNDTFFTQWVTSFFTAATTVIPLGLITMALLTKEAEKRLPKLSTKARDVLIGISMACIMESGMAFTTALNNIGLENRVAFFSAWLDGLLGALPIALVLMTITSMTIKPKVEKFLKN